MDVSTLALRPGVREESAYPTWQAALANILYFEIVSILKLTLS